MARILVFAFIGTVLMVEAVPSKVKIGALLAFNSTIGNAALAAMQLAIQHINQNDTILNGTLLELKAYDTHCNAFHGAAAAIALMGEEVAAIAGPQTSEASQFVAHMAGEDVKSTLGRAVLIIWLVVVLILISSYTAGYTSILTVQQLVPTIDGISGLLESNVPIGFQAGSFVESYLLNLNVPKSRLVPLNSMASYARALYDGPSKGGVGAIVDELRYVQLFLSSECEFKISGQDFTRAGWGFAFPKGSTLAVDISQAILTLDENGALQRLEEEWLQGAECDSQYLEVGGNQLGLHNYWALFAIYGGVAMFACLLYSLRLLWQYYRLKHPSTLQQNSCFPRSGRYITCSEARSL